MPKPSSAAEPTVTFWGAARTVTGSMHQLTANGKTVLLDCGLFQGKRNESAERNRDFPFRAKEAIQGVQLTRLGSRVYQDTLVKKVDPRGRDYYWIGGEDPLWKPHPGTDFQAVHDGFVSVTPMQLELSDERAITDMREWALHV